MSYTYDKLVRLLIGSSAGTTVMVEALTYDDRGNIRKLARNNGDYIKLFSASDFPFASLLELDNRALAELFSSYTTIDNDRHNEMMLFFEGVNRARHQTGFTFLYHLDILE